MSITVYFADHACSRIVLAALEKIGCGYAGVKLDLRTGEQKHSEFLALNDKGKVPVMVIDGVTVTETPVILHVLATRYPAARLLPSSDGKAPDTRGLSDLVWCAGALHPMLHRFFRPGAYSDADPEGVKAVALRQLDEVALRIAARVATSWWYGQDWSIVDVYFAWLFGGAAALGFPIRNHPSLADHLARSEAMPIFQQACARERAA